VAEIHLEVNAANPLKWWDGLRFLGKSREINAALMNSDGQGWNQLMQRRNHFLEIFLRDHGEKGKPRQSLM
jgi:hypothetical protein